MRKRIHITVWNESTRIWVANRLSALHINFTSEDYLAFVIYDMKVSDEQLSDIVAHIIPRGDTSVEMILKTGVSVKLKI